jgi:hypothetical protein
MAWMKPAAKRNLQRTAVVMAVYAIGLFAASYLIRRQGVSGPLAYGVALIPGLATVGLFWSTGKMIVETEDEFMRMLAVRQQLIAVGFAMSIACVWGFLEMFDLVPHVEAFYVMILWAVGVFVGMIANRITHGVWGQCP